MVPRPHAGAKNINFAYVHLSISVNHFCHICTGEFSMDQTAILQKAESNSGMVTPTILITELGWDSERCQRAFDQ